MTDNANVKQERVSITAFISKDTRDKLLRIAEDEDLTFSAVVRLKSTRTKRQFNSKGGTK